MLTALAHFILACSRSRSLIADSIRDEPEKWEIKDTGSTCYELLRRKDDIRVWCGHCTSDLRIKDLKRDIGWAERKLIRNAVKAHLGQRLAKQRRQLDKALKAALTGDE